MMNKIFIQHHHRVCTSTKLFDLLQRYSLFSSQATPQRDPSPSLFNNSNNPEHSRIYNQAVLLNSLIRNMVNDNSIQNSSSNESCLSNDTQVNGLRMLNCISKKFFYSAFSP